VLALVPILATVVRAIVIGWVPIFDAGYFTVRSRDVLTANHPWLGAWSSASVTLGETVRNLGPLQLDLLAPFTKVDPYLGTGVGVGAVAAGSVVAVWWSARRVLGPVGAGAAMLATIALEAAIGTQSLIDPRQQIYLLLPYWAMLWLTWAAAMGEGRAIAPLVFVASLILQTHFTFLLQTVLLLLAGVGVYVWRARRQWHEVRATKWLSFGLAVAFVCWLQPLWDQLFGERNLGAVLGERGANEGVGWGDGASVVAGTVLVPPRFWLPDSLGSFDLPADIVEQRWAWIVLTGWFLLVAGAATVAWRRGFRGLAGLGLIAAVTLVGTVVAAARIPSSRFGLIPQNYFWMWPTGVFLTVAVAAGLLVLTARGRRWLSSPAGLIGLVVAGLVAAVVAAQPVDYFAPVPSAQTAGERVARPVVEQLATGLRRHAVTGPVVVDYSRASFGTYLRYVFLAELQRADIEFLFPPDDENINRFGRRRCDDGDAVSRIVLADAGGDPLARPGESILAHVDEFSADDERELAGIERRFGDALRDGTVELDVEGFEFLTGELPRDLRDVLSTPGRAATGLASTIAFTRSWGVSEMSADLHHELDRWIDLQERAAVEDVTILLAPRDDGGGRPVTAVGCLS
jgi:hypothetical protein